jgi:hypothetical protein
VPEYEIGRKRSRLRASGLAALHENLDDRRVTAKMPAPMKDITELRRLASPAPRPQCLVFDGGTLWMGSIETSRIYEIDPVAWKVRRDWEAPGKPWGMTCIGPELRNVTFQEGAHEQVSPFE